MSQDAMELFNQLSKTEVKKEAPPMRLFPESKNELAIQLEIAKAQRVEIAALKAEIELLKQAPKPAPKANTTKKNDVVLARARAMREIAKDPDRWYARLPTPEFVTMVRGSPCPVGAWTLDSVLQFVNETHDEHLGLMARSQSA